MSKPELIKLSGWMLISGAVAFITILSNSHDTQHSGSILSALLLTVGMSGLREAYGERAGRFWQGHVAAGYAGACYLGRRHGIHGPYVWFWEPDCHSG